MGAESRAQNIMMIKNVTGFVDARQYKKGTPRSNRAIVDVNGRINLSVGFEEAEIPTEIKEFASLHEKSGKWFVTFKIFPHAKWYNHKAQKIEKLSNEELDGMMLIVNLDFNIKHGTGTEPNGCYVNSIQIVRDASNPFEAVDGGNDKWMRGEAVKPSFDPIDIVDALGDGEEKTEEDTSLPF